MSLVWKRGWIAVVLIEIVLREISQRDVGEVAGETSGEQVSRQEEAEIKIGIAGRLMPQAARLWASVSHSNWATDPEAALISKSGPGQGRQKLISGGASQRGFVHERRR